SHFAAYIGHFPKTTEMLESIEFPQELILNADKDRFFGYIKQKRNIDFIDIK
ncbi:MAG: hypothetical protein K0R90_876, partial [Oscillospiraceae bacterium]|nr:hypothetical protein [Oscillospiraceae bacterium]